jgi:hypothetical protein
MLTFTLYTADEYDRSRRTVHIDPAAVISVEETERRPAFGGWCQVAIITLTTGDKYIVEDDSRTAARMIAEAKLQARMDGILAVVPED